MLTTKEISDMLNVSEETVRRWIRTQELKAHQEGKSYIVDKEDLIEFVRKKSKDGATSIGKIATIGAILGGIGAIAPLPVGSIASDITTKLVKMINNSKSETKQANEITEIQVVDMPSIAEIEDAIRALEHKKKKLDLEYQMNVLQIDEQIAEYQILKKRLEE